MHYLWQHQAFDFSHLRTVSGQTITVSSVGIHNEDAGPDFSLARLFIDDLDWSGSVEIHVKSSEWNHHKHQLDTAYDRVILHVVWQYDQEIYRSDGTSVPTLELKNRVDSAILLKIDALLNTTQPSIACAYQAEQVTSLTKTSQIERAAAQRLERKAEEILKLVEENRGDWEETAYQWLFRGFGFQVNAEAMLELAKVFPLRWVRKYHPQPDTLQALLLTQAGLSGYINDAGPEIIYPSELARQKLNASIWRYSRMRPANFPHARIAQLSGLLYHWKASITWLFEPLSLEEFINQFQAQSATSAPLGKQSIENLIINVLVPLLTAYGLFHREELLQQHAWQLLEKLPPENNRITRIYSKLSFVKDSALDTQGMIEQYQSFCQKKKCLKCSIGAAVMKKSHLFVS
nr:DUF2851 family protein [Tunicatimonas sp. TK19036]